MVWRMLTACPPEGAVPCPPNTLVDLDGEPLPPHPSAYPFIYRLTRDTPILFYQELGKSFVLASLFDYVHENIRVPTANGWSWVGYQAEWVQERKK